jgi:hypothetical protein
MNYHLFFIIINSLTNLNKQNSNNILRTFDHCASTLAVELTNKQVGTIVCGRTRSAQIVQAHTLKIRTAQQGANKVTLTVELTLTCGTKITSASVHARTYFRI